MSHIPRADLFEFICGWDFQPEADRLQVLAEYYMTPPDDEVTAEAGKDWNDLAPAIREALEDAAE